VRIKGLKKSPKITTRRHSSLTRSNHSNPAADATGAHYIQICVCMYIYKCTCIYIFLYTCRSIYVYTCLHVYYSHVYACMIRLFIYTYLRNAYTTNNSYVLKICGGSKGARRATVAHLKAQYKSCWLLLPNFWSPVAAHQAAPQHWMAHVLDSCIVRKNLTRT